MALCSIAIAAGVVGAFTIVKGLFLKHRFGHHHAFAGGSCGRGEGFEDHGPPWARRAWGGSRIGRSFWLRALLARLDTTPGQEREIRAAIEELRDRALDAKSSVREARENLGRAIGSDIFDDGAFEAASARADATSEKVKDAVRGALKRIHAVLDAKQRERLASIVAEGGFTRWGRGGRGSGPYRDAAF